MLTARTALWNEFTRLHREMLKIARADRVCRRLMSAPGVGALVALTYRSAVDDPSRFGKSGTIGAYFGLTPKKFQSGETDRDGGVSKVGDAMVRTALFEAAHTMLTRAVRFSSLKRWALDVAKRRGMKRAKVALARKLGVVLHRMWRGRATRRESSRPKIDRDLSFGARPNSSQLATQLKRGRRPTTVRCVRARHIKLTDARASPARHNVQLEMRRGGLSGSYCWAAVLRSELSAPPLTHAPATPWIADRRLRAGESGDGASRHGITKPRRLLP